MDHNRVVQVGRLAADPVLTQGKKPPGPDGVRSDDRIWTRLAVNRPKVKGEERGADFFPLCAWGKLAHVFMKYCKQGKEVLVEGALRTNPKQRPDKSWDNYTEIVVHNVVLGSEPRDKVSHLDNAPDFVLPPAPQQVVQPIVDPARLDQITAMVVASIKQQLAEQSAKSVNSY